MSNETSQTLSRGLDVLELVAASTSGLTPTQIAAELGLGRTIVYRLIGTLIDHRLLARDADGALSIALGAYRLVENLPRALRRSTDAVLQSLADDLAATAYLAVIDGTESLAVSVVEPRDTTFHLSYRVGARHPLDRGAIGRALQAAARGERGLFETEDELIAGASGIAGAVPNLQGLSCAIGIVTLSEHMGHGFGARVARAVDELLSQE